MITPHGMFDQEVTRLPFEGDHAAKGWKSDEVSLYALSEPIYGMFGEEANHFIISRFNDDTENDAVAVFATTEDGKMLTPAPMGLASREHTDAEILAALNFRDVTAA